MQQLDILFNLIDFEFVMCGPECGIVLLISCNFGLRSAVKEIEPAQRLVILRQILAKSQRLSFSQAKFDADELNGCRSWYLFSCEEVPNEGYFANDHLYIVVADEPIPFSVQVVETNFGFLLVGSVIDLV